MITQEENKERLQAASFQMLADELDGLGYDGVDQMDPDDVFDTLLEIYQQFPEKIPGNEDFV